MGRTQKAVLRRLAARPDQRGDVRDLAFETEKTPSAVHAALVRLVANGLVDRSPVSNSYRYTLTALGERVAEELGEG